MKKTIKINESQIRNIIRNVLNEIGSATIDRALRNSPEINRNDDAFKNRSIPFDWDYPTAANGIRYIKEVLDAYEESYHGYGDAQVKRCQVYLKYITDFLRRKSKQQGNLSKGYEDYRYEEEYSFYASVAKLLGVRFNPNTVNDIIEKEKIERILFSRTERQINDLISKLPEDAQEFYRDNF